MTDIDNSKNVYLFTRGRADLVEKSIELLTSNGFSKEKIIMADPKKAGDVDDYMKFSGGDRVENGCFQRGIVNLKIACFWW